MCEPTLTPGCSQKSGTDPRSVTQLATWPVSAASSSCSVSTWFAT